MAISDVPTWGLLVGSVLAVLWLGSLRARRSGTASSYWLAGWVSIFCGGLLSEILAESPATIALRIFLLSQFGFLMLAGARAFAGREVPPALFWIAAATGLVRTLATWTGHAHVQMLLHVCGEPIALLGACAIAARAHPPSRDFRALLAPGFALLASAEVIDALGPASTAQLVMADWRWLVWIGVSIPNVVVQIASVQRNLLGETRKIGSALQQKEEQLRALLDSLGRTRVVLLDCDARVRSAFGALPSGISGEQIFGQRLDAFLGQADAAVFATAVRRVCDSGEPQHFDAHFSLPRDTYRVSVELAPVRDAHGRIEAVLAVLSDISERERAMRELHRSEQRLQATLSALSQNRILILDRECRIESIVGRVKLPSPPEGLHWDQVEGRSIDAFVPAADREHVYSAVAEVYSTGESRSLRQRTMLPGGTFHVDVALRPLLGESGAVERVLAVCTDVTEQVRAEEERRRLEGRILEAQKLESVAVLAGGVAHDFNNLLSAILGSVELALARLPRGSEAEVLLRDALRAGDRAIDLTNQLLAYAGKAPLSIGTIDLVEITAEMAALLRGSLRSGARIAIDRQIEHAWLRGDATQIRQLVLNLMANAADALGEASGTVSVSIGSRAATALDLADGAFGASLPPGEYVALEVRDDGCGMDEATQQRIFEPFFTTKFEGRGLGLAAAMGIVRGHRGALQVRSAPGIGTCFRLLLPCAEAPAAGARTRSDTTTARVGVRGSVLVVDDEDAVRRVAARMLEALGFDALQAESGERALALLVEHKGAVSAALVDLTMPGWDGARAARELLRIEPALPIVFMSGHSEHDPALRIGPDEVPFLKKPFRLEQLAARFEKLPARGA